MMFYALDNAKYFFNITVLIYSVHQCQKYIKTIQFKCILLILFTITINLFINSALK